MANLEEDKNPGATESKTKKISNSLKPIKSKELKNKKKRKVTKRTTLFVKLEGPKDLKRRKWKGNEN